MAASRRQFLRAAGAAVAATAFAQGVAGKYNALFIAVDDLKPALGCYGDPLPSRPTLTD